MRLPWRKRAPVLHSSIEQATIDERPGSERMARADIAEAGAKRLSTQEMGDAVLNALEKVVAKEKERA